MDTQSRRSGLDRRKEANSAVEEKRSIADRREVNRTITDIEEFIQKIPLFKGLHTEQVKKILTICSMKTYPKGHFVCQEGDESKELFIFLEGQLKVVKNDVFLAYISPYGLVGEIGVFTGQTRSASVVNITESKVIRISKIELFQLLKYDHDMNNCILLNVISDLAQKLQKDNELIEKLRNYNLPTML